MLRQTYVAGTYCHPICSDKLYLLYKVIKVLRKWLQNGWTIFSKLKIFQILRKLSIYKNTKRKISPPPHKSVL